VSSTEKDAIEASLSQRENSMSNSPTQPIDLSVRHDTFPIRGTFTISRGSRTEIHVVVAELRQGPVVGRGECVPYARYGETVDGVTADISRMAAALAAGELNRENLQQALPAGAARNALDCAFWDLEAKRSGQSIAEMAGLASLAPVVTAYTISLDSPAAMGANAAENAYRPLLKLKLAGPDDLDRVRAVRQNAPNATLVVDANEGWTVDDYLALAPALQALGVAMIEQPLPAAEDAALRGVDRLVPLCADESCHDSTTLDQLLGKYDYINIKLDKTGGLTEALKLKAQARAAGFKIMVGCMIGTSLAMAPGLVVAQGAELVDLDAPLLIAKDRETALRYDGSLVHPPSAALWG
jgi:L-alanine-DL-glutamate epimerase-like enolase superfamily enzyme